MPKPPPRDQHGKIVPHDHSDILDEDYVIRHTTPQDLCDDDGGKRLSSGAFSESEGGGMSVDIEKWMKLDGLDSLHYVTDTTHSAVRLKVGDLRKQGLLVGWDPDNGHKHHGGVWGIGNGSKRRRRVLDIAISLKRVPGETLPIPRRKAAEQAWSEVFVAQERTIPSVKTEGVPRLETVLIPATISLYDIYVNEGGHRTWIGSRRTLTQCEDAFNAYCRLKSPRK